MEDSGIVKTLSKFLSYVSRDSTNWEFATPSGRAWFRGQRNAAKPPRPSIFRHEYNEHGLTNMFRYRAAAYAPVPDRTGCTDQWLFLMQHFGVPTRLLDWTESALAAIFFAVFQKDKDKPQEDTDAAVWMLHPLKMNALKESIGKQDFPNTWANFQGNVVRNNIDRAFWTAGKPTRLPIAILPTFDRSIMSSQKSCFTVQGSNESDFESLFQGTSLIRKGFFKKYLIPRDCCRKIEKELDRVGITNSAVFPDLKGLALELEQRFRLDK